MIMYNMVRAHFSIHLQVIMVIMLSNIMVCVCGLVFGLQVTKLMFVIMYNMVRVRFIIHLRVIV